MLKEGRRGGGVLLRIKLTVEPGTERSSGSPRPPARQVYSQENAAGPSALVPEIALFETRPSAPKRNSDTPARSVVPLPVSLVCALLDTAS